MAAIIQQHSADLCELEAIDTGLPLTQIESSHMPATIATLEYYASAIQTGRPGKILDTPLGVTLHLIPLRIHDENHWVCVWALVLGIIPSWG
jgi:acyl-CoA reductase-like NAD-dependent aldehyde dehydrogenase